MRNMPLRIACSGLACAVGMLILQGCAHVRTETVRPRLSDTILTITRSGEAVTLGWETEVGKTYTVVYSSDLRQADGWQPLPSCAARRGTGRYMTVSDSVPSNEQRYYRLQVTPAAK